MAGSFGGSLDVARGSKTGLSSTVSGKRISQEGYDKIIYDVLSSDQGLAALAQGENTSGGFGATSKGLMAQDLTAKLAGQLALMQAEEYSDTISKETTKNTKASASAKNTVICTELARQGKLDSTLYILGTPHFLKLSPITVSGYHWWATKLVPLMQKSERLSNFFLPTAVARYNYIVHGKKSFLGCATVFIGEPLCYVLGVIRNLGTRHALKSA